MPSARVDGARAAEVTRAVLAAARQAGRTTELRRGAEEAAAAYYAERLAEQLHEPMPGMRAAIAEAFLAGARERRSGMVEA